MNDDKLVAIEARAKEYISFDDIDDTEDVGWIITNEDIPTLVAEVRDLQAQLEGTHQIVRDAAQTLNLVPAEGKTK